jgi:dTDP-4-dehydrorhamnose 3,5-epimerase
VRFTPTPLDGAYVIELDPVADERGSFARIWCRDELAEAGLDPELAQCSISTNERAGTVRGMHFQRPPHEETKIVRCIRGAVFDVIVDLRPSSPTYTGWTGVHLDAESRTALYIPKGFAHGFQALTDGAEILYMISHPYAPEAAAGVRWDDPAFAIGWPLPVSTMSEKDRTWPDHDPTPRKV